MPERTLPSIHINGTSRQMPLLDYRGQHSISVALRFWSKVDTAPIDMCWEWLAKISKPSPYPRFKLGDYATTAHRVA